MSRTLMLALLLAAAPAAQAHDGVRLGCDIGSDWNVKPYRKAFLFTREDGADVAIGGGRLFSGGKEIALSPADHGRVAGIESEMRALVPELHEVSREAVEIAFAALIEVARGLSSDPRQTIADLQRARVSSLAEIDAQPMAVFDGDAMEGIVEPILQKFIPDVAGGAVSAALKAAFAGEAKRQEFQARMDRMERELHQRVDARAKALEPKAQAVCTRLERMDGLDDALELRLPGGEAPQLFRIDPHHGNDKP